METIEEVAELIKSVFEDIEHHQINKILYCEICNNFEKLETLEEALDRLKLMIEEIENTI
jgi:predicted RNase H-like HicB family nuclease